MDKADEKIKNNRSVEELYRKIDKVMEKLNYKKRLQRMEKLK